jgi:acyl-CoA reductase-like NAD-dependent aldehyde dehydrogenase
MTPELTTTREPASTDASRAVKRAGRGAAAARRDARSAVEAAERAFPDWSTTAPGERSALLEQARDLLMERQAAIAALVTEETCGTVGWGMFNVQLGADMLTHYAGQTDAPAEEQEIPSHIPGKRAKAIRQPVGVVLGIAPWNAPVVLGVRAIAAPRRMETPSCSKPRSGARARTRRSSRRCTTRVYRPARSAFSRTIPRTRLTWSMS